MNTSLFYKDESLTSCRKGFTLIELVVAILIFAIGIIGISKMQIMAVQANAFSMQLTRANNEAKNTIEQLMGLPQSDSAFGGATALAATYTTQWPGVTDANVIYTPSWSVNQIAGTSFRQVDVSVTWNEKTLSHSITITFFKGP
jgi:prepilin-type N-terminal cleavage/methylation domain-containing protein